MITKKITQTDVGILSTLTIMENEYDQRMQVIIEWLRKFGIPVYGRGRCNESDKTKAIQNIEIFMKKK